MCPLEIDETHDLAIIRTGCRWAVLQLGDVVRVASALPAARLTVASSGGRSVPAVRHADHGRLILARLLTGAAAHQQVHYRDGDPFNLTRANLVIEDTAKRFKRTRPVPTMI